MTTALASNLYELRKAKGLTQKEVSSKVNISQKSYSNLETGITKAEKIDYRILLRLSRFFGVSVDRLMSSDSLKTLYDLVVFTIPVIEWENVRNWIADKDKESMQLMVFERVPFVDSSYQNVDHLFALRITTNNPQLSLKEDDIVYIDPDLRASVDDVVLASVDTESSPILMRYSRAIKQSAVVGVMIGVYRKATRKN